MNYISIIILKDHPQNLVNKHLSSETASLKKKKRQWNSIFKIVKENNFKLIILNSVKPFSNMRA